MEKVFHPFGITGRPKNHDSLAFLLFQTDEKPFPFKENDDDNANNESEGEVIEAELDADTSETTEEVKD